MVSCSVVIPNYNHEKYLRERIQSILDQKNVDVELILLDDASTDNSVQVITQFLPSLKENKVIVNEVNSNSTYSQWNLGVAKASYNLIQIAESDDTAQSELLLSLSKKFDEDEGVVLSFCKSNLIDERSEKIGVWHYDDPVFDRDFIMDGDVFIEKYLIYKNVIPNASSVLFRKDVYLSGGLAEISLKTNGDWLVWLKILCKGKVAYTANPLNNFRKHENSVTARNNSLDFIHYQEIYSKTLRKEFRKYLKTLFPNKKFYQIHRINENYISYDYGYQSLYLLKNKKYMHSLLVLVQSFFTGDIKTYFIKKYSVDFYNYLFKR